MDRCVQWVEPFKLQFDRTKYVKKEGEASIPTHDDPPPFELTDEEKAQLEARQNKLADEEVGADDDAEDLELTI